MTATCAWCLKPRPRIALGWKEIRGFHFCPDHRSERQIDRIVTRDAECLACGGSRPSDALERGWTMDGSSWWCSGCRELEAGRAWAYDDSARPEIAAAKYLIRWCDEIDDRWRRLGEEEARAEAEPFRARIRSIGHALDAHGGETAMRAALDLVAHEANPLAALVPRAVLSGVPGGSGDSAAGQAGAREATLRSHVSYIDREWSGIGRWQ